MELVEYQWLMMIMIESTLTEKNDNEDLAAASFSRNPWLDFVQNWMNEQHNATSTNTNL